MPLRRDAGTRERGFRVDFRPRVFVFANQAQACVPRDGFAASRIRRDSLPGERRAYFVAVIESTLIVLVLASSMPVTRTFCAANFEGVS